ncbi:hypothetical protein HBA_0102 [Sodalis endosymbiont of Henestaris halophilus]|nr:hypothetical protein HBA_0102 [Sodalis endosymbiont of Henestaris halophilus]
MNIIIYFIRIIINNTLINTYVVQLKSSTVAKKTNNVIIVTVNDRQNTVINVIIKNAGDPLSAIIASAAGSNHLG